MPVVGEILSSHSAILQHIQSGAMLCDRILQRNTKAAARDHKIADDRDSTAQDGAVHDSRHAMATASRRDT